MAVKTKSKSIRWCAVTPQERSHKASMDRPTRVRRINLSLGQLESGGQDLRRMTELGRDSREGEGRNITEIHQMFKLESALKPTEQASIFTDEKTKAQRRAMTHQVSLRIDSLNSTSGFLDLCCLGPGPLMSPSSAMVKLLGVCLSPAHAPCHNPYGSLLQNHRWVNLHVHELRFFLTSLPFLCCALRLGYVPLPTPNL